MADDMGSFVNSILSAISHGSGPDTPTADDTPEPETRVDDTAAQKAQQAADPVASPSLLSVGGAMEAASKFTKAYAELAAHNDTNTVGGQWLTSTLGSGQSPDAQNASIMQGAIQGAQSGATAAIAKNEADSSKMNQDVQAVRREVTAGGGTLSGESLLTNSDGTPIDGNGAAALKAAQVRKLSEQQIQLENEIQDRTSTSFFDDPLKFIQGRFGLNHVIEKYNNNTEFLNQEQTSLNAMLGAQTSAARLSAAEHGDRTAAQIAADNLVIASGALKDVSKAQADFYARGMQGKQLALATRTEDFHEIHTAVQEANDKARLALEQDRQPLYTAYKEEQILKVQQINKELNDKLGAEQAANMKLSMASSAIGQEVTIAGLKNTKDNAQIAATLHLADQFTISKAEGGIGMWGNTPGQAWANLYDAKAVGNPSLNIMRDRLYDKVVAPMIAQGIGAKGGAALKDDLGLTSAIDRGVKVLLPDSTGIMQPQTLPGVEQYLKQESIQRDEVGGLYRLPPITQLLSSGPNGQLPEVFTNNSLVPGLKQVASQLPSEPFQVDRVYKEASALLANAPKEQKSALVEKLARDGAAFVANAMEIHRQQAQMNSLNLPSPTTYNKDVAGKTTDWANPIAWRTRLLRDESAKARDDMMMHALQGNY